MPYNPVRAGLLRDVAVVDMVGEHGVLTAEQIAALLFHGEYRLNKAQQRLKLLSDRGRLRRRRLGQRYYYSAGRAEPGQLEHLVAVNWVYVWLATRLRGWEHITEWRREVACGDLRADAFCAVENTWTGEHKCYFVEVDCSHNAWTKARDYNAVYAGEGYREAEWLKYAGGRFPIVLCVASEAARAWLMRRAIERDNACGLRFEVRLLEEMVKEVMDVGRPSDRGGDRLRLALGVRRRGAQSEAGGQVHESADPAVGG